MKKNYLKSNNFYCSCCKVNFTSKVLLQAHCQTPEHQSCILSDEGRDWKYRPPPRILSSNEYVLCPYLFGKNVLGCRLGDQCIHAHSPEEMSEWKERCDYRNMKCEKAKQKELFGTSFADNLLEKLNLLQNTEAILSEKVTCFTFSFSF